MTTRIDRASRVIDAPPSTIFQAFASADAFMAWLPPQGMTGQVFVFDFREGGGYRMRLTLDEPGEVPGKTSEDADDVNVRFVKILPDELIAQEVSFDSKEPRFAGVMKMTWSFQPAADGTDVSVTAEDVPYGISPQDHLARFVEQED